MADNYKEGVDFEMIDKGGYKTRRFFTKKEKQDRTLAPKTSPRPPAKPKVTPKLKGITTVPITTSTLPSKVTPYVPVQRPMNYTAPKTPITGTSKSGGLRTTTATNKLGSSGGAGGEMPRVDAMGNAYRKGGMVSKPKAGAKKMLPAFMKGKK